jgi:spore coat protein CotF
VLNKIFPHLLKKHLYQKEYPITNDYTLLSLYDEYKNRNYGKIIMEVVILALKLTAKEKMLLQDQKAHEELCIKKYQNHSQQAQDPQLKQLFSSLGQKEQEHLNSINQILAGQVPNVQQNQQTGQQMMQMEQQVQQNQQNQMPGGTMTNQNDSTLCSDMLATEKYVSGTYDTTIFECTNTNVRQVLNHIQKEEQEHGEQIFTYMQNRGMYNPQ